jgi:hypothetical protein
MTCSCSTGFLLSPHPSGLVGGVLLVPLVLWCLCYILAILMLYGFGLSAPSLPVHSHIHDVFQ